MVFLLGVLANRGQGAAIVSLSNYDAKVPIYLMWSPDSRTTNLYYEILGGPVGGDLLPLMSLGTTQTVISAATSGAKFGFFDGGIGIVPGIVGGQPADFQVRAWAGLPGTTYATAPVKGETSRWTQTTGAWDDQELPALPPVPVSLKIPEAITVPQTNYYEWTTEVVGSGSVAFSPEPLVSGFPKGAAVVATAVPDAGWEFSRWQNGDNLSEDSLTLTVDGDLKLVAEFTKMLSLTLLPADHGRIEVAPAKPFYSLGETVTVKAVPDQGYYFIIWTGELGQILVRDEASQKINLQQNWQLGAYFSAAPLPPIITQQPVSQYVGEGQNAVFSLAARGVELTFQWYQNDVLLPGETNSTLLITSVTTKDNDSIFDCRVGNSGGTVNSDPVTLHVIKDPPVITEQSPSSITVTNGARPSVFVKATGEDLHYAWYQAGVKISGATNSVYFLPTLWYSQPNGFEVHVEITNAVGSVRSSETWVYVAPPLLPTVKFEPAATDRTVYVGDSVEWRVVAGDSGLNAFTYQWYFGYWPIINATNATFNLSSVSYQNAGQYYCQVKNWVGVSQSAPLSLYVLKHPPVPVILSQPKNLEVHVGQMAGFYVAAANTDGLQYQWQYNGQSIPNETNAVLYLDNVQPEQAGGYRAVLVNPYGTATSDYATNTVRLDPFIDEQPRNTIASVGAPVLLWLRVYGQEPFTYQWRFNGVDIPGATNVDYSLPAVAQADSGKYTVAVSNAAGFDVSAPATMAVRPGPQIMGIRVENNAVILTLRTKPGRAYRVETSPDWTHWAPLQTVTTAAELEDHSFDLQSQPQQAYYRLVEE